MYSGSENSSDVNPLCMACITGHLEIASYLVSKNVCDVDGVFKWAWDQGYHYT